MEIIYLQRFSLRNNNSKRHVSTQSQEEGLRTEPCYISSQSTCRGWVVMSPAFVPRQVKPEKNEVIFYCPSSLTCQACHWKELIVASYVIQDRLFPSGCMTFWLHHRCCQQLRSHHGLGIRRAWWHPHLFLGHVRWRQLATCCSSVMKQGYRTVISFLRGEIQPVLFLLQISYVSWCNWHISSEST